MSGYRSFAVPSLTLLASQAMHWLAERTKHGPEADGALLVLLDESEASNVRPRIVEEKERARAKPNYNKMICMSCKQVGNVTDLVKHAKKEYVCFVS